MNKYDENLVALLGLIIKDLGNMKKDYNAEDLIRFQKLEECFADFKNLCADYQFTCSWRDKNYKRPRKCKF